MFLRGELVDLPARECSVLVFMVIKVEYVCVCVYFSLCVGVSISVCVHVCARVYMCLQQGLTCGLRFKEKKSPSSPSGISMAMFSSAPPSPLALAVETSVVLAPKGDVDEGRVAEVEAKFASACPSVLDVVPTLRKFTEVSVCMVGSAFGIVVMLASASSSSRSVGVLRGRYVWMVSEW